MISSFVSDVNSSLQHPLKILMSRSAFQINEPSFKMCVLSTIPNKLLPINYSLVQFLSFKLVLK